ncbi:MAG: serine hydrolase [bacterium]
MPIFRKTLLIFASTIFYVGLICFLNSSIFNFNLLNKQKDADGKTIVLGANEARAENSVNKTVNEYGLPQSEDVPELSFVVPQKKDGAVEIEIGSSFGIVIDEDSGKTLYKKNEDVVTSVASLTKLMTAMIFLDSNVPFDDVYEIKDSDKEEGGREYLYRGDKIKIIDLLNLSLIGSINTATKALAQSTGMTEKEFVSKMNQRAHDMGLEKTNFTDTVGLSDNNVSTALEMSKIVKEALSSEQILEITQNKKYEFITLQGRKGVVYATDLLLEVFPFGGINILGGKTGYTNAAGYCFAGKFINSNENKIISVVLRGQDIDSRFDYTRKIVEWVYDNYVW